MLISDTKLIGMPVETEDKTLVGKIIGLEIEIDSQSILNYRIKPTGVINSLLKNDLIITRGQVLSITAKKMIIASGALKDKKRGTVKEKYANKKTAAEVLYEPSGKHCTEAHTEH